MVSAEWVVQLLEILYVFIAFVLTTILILSTRHDFLIHFEKLSLQNR